MSEVTGHASGGPDLDGILLPEMPKQWLNGSGARETVERAGKRAVCYRQATTYNDVLEIAETLEAEARDLRRLVSTWRDHEATT